MCGGVQGRGQGARRARTHKSQQSHRLRYYNSVCRVVYDMTVIAHRKRARAQQDRPLPVSLPHDTHTPTHAHTHIRQQTRRPARGASSHQLRPTSPRNNQQHELSRARTRRAPSRCVLSIEVGAHQVPIAYLPRGDTVCFPRADIPLRPRFMQALARRSRGCTHTLVRVPPRSAAPASARAPGQPARRICRRHRLRHLQNSSSRLARAVVALVLRWQKQRTP